MARGRPSRRAQISATARAFWSVMRKAGLMSWARSTKAHRLELGQLLPGAGAPGRAGSRGHLELPLAVEPQHRPAGDQDVERGAGQQQVAHERRATSATCSKLSRISSGCPARAPPASPGGGGRRLALSTWATHGPTRAGSLIRARATKTPSGKSSRGPGPPGWPGGSCPSPRPQEGDQAHVRPAQELVADGVDLQLAPDEQQGRPGGEVVGPALQGAQGREAGRQAGCSSW